MSKRGKTGIDSVILEFFVGAQGDPSPRNRGKPGYPLGGIKPVYPPEGMDEEKAPEPKGKDLGHGFNEDGFPIQDRYEFQGLPISVENRRGSIRKWYDKDGKEKGRTKMRSDYGFVEGAIGADGEPVDVYVGTDEDAEYVFVVHQNKAPDFETYDEDKVMLGFPSEEAARKAYLKQYDDPRFYGGMSSMPLEKFREKLKVGGKITNEGLIRESKVPKSIEHLEDLSPDSFMRWLEKYKDLPIKGGLEVSEKVDGSARITFGVEGGKLWTQSKNGPKRFSADQYQEPTFKALKMAHRALDSAPVNLVSRFPPGVTFVAEVLYTRIPNSIEYGENRIVVHGVYKDGQPLNDSTAQKLATSVIERAAGLTDGTDEWKFEYKRVLSAEDVYVDVRKEYDTIGQVYQELKKLEPNRLKAAGKGPYKATAERFKNVQVALKKKLVGQLRKQKSAYGPEGGDIEGLVFKDLESGSMTKLVDKEYFTKLNRFLWHYRELLGKGIKVGDQWTVGVMQQLRNKLADEVMGHPMAKTPAFVTKLQEFGKSLEYPPQADTSEKKSDFLLSQYVKQNKLMGGDFLKQSAEIISQIDTRFQELRGEWESKKKKDLTFTAKDDDGKAIKKVKMDPLIKQRTDAAFGEMEEFITGFRKALEAIGGMKGELTKRTALLKLSLGQNRLEKLQGQPEEVTEGLVLEKRFNERDIALVLASASKKLSARGIVVGNFLGSGNMGQTFDSRGGRVLKVTTDATEARASNLLKGKGLRRAVKVFEVFKFPPIAGVTTPYFGILQEKLQKLSPQEEREIDDATQVIADAADDYSRKWPNDWPSTLKKLQLKAKQSPPAAQEIQDAIVTVEKYDLIGICDELKTHGVRWGDLKSDNLMKRGSEVVAIDLGLSDSGGAEPDVLEQRIVEDLGRNTSAVVGTWKKDLTQRFGKITGILGTGSHGQAYSLSNGRVLKITDDETEARTANHLKGKKLDHVVSIGDVVKLPTKGQDWFAIEQERLQPLPEDPALKSAILFFTKRTWGVGREVFSPWEVPWDELRSGVQKTTEGDPDEEREFAAHVKTLEKYQVPEIMKDLQRHKVSYSDLHSGNVMRRGDKIVVTDLGARSPGKLPDVIETIVEAMATTVERAEAPDSIDEPTAREFLEKYRGQLVSRKINVPSKPRCLGVGTRGAAFDLGGGKVLKVTGDRSEALVATRIKGRNMRYVVDVYDTFQFGDSGIYAIHQEKLDPLPGSSTDMDDAEGESAELNDCLGTFTMNGILPEEFKSWEDFKNAAVKVVTTKRASLPPDRANRLTKEMAHAIKVFKHYNIDRMMDELASQGIFTGDFHSGNIMKKGDRYVLIDLGNSDVAGASEPDVVETIIRETINERLEPSVMKILNSVLARNKPALAKRGIKDFKRLGMGSNGIAYDIGGGRVFKITLDEDEAKSSGVIKGKKLDHFCRIFDVFRFKTDDVEEGPIYGIVQEKLTPLDASTSKELSHHIDVLDSYTMNMWAGKDWKKSIDHALGVHGHKSDLDSAIDFLESNGIFQIFDELSKNGVDWMDVHPENLMKRGDKIVGIDLGMSDSEGQEPAMLEQLTESIFENITEAKADTVGVTIGRFQPFHKGHAEIIRKLAGRFTKVIVIVAGNRQDKRNPFSWDLRKRMMELSLPDILNKVEFHKAEVNGKGNGFIPGVLSDISLNKRSSVQKDTAFTIMVGPDRLEDVKAQMAKAVQYAERGGDLYIDPTLAMVESLPGVKNDDDTDRISGTKLRELIAADEKEAAKPMFDSRLISNPTEFDSIWEELVEELSVQTGAKKPVKEDVAIDEDLQDAGGPNAIADALRANAKSLSKKGIKVDNLKGLGQGMDGVAFDMGANRVLKVTTEPTEAKAAMELMSKGKNLKHIFKIFDVFHFRNPGKAKGDIYGIVTEKLTELSKNEADSFDEATDWLVGAAKTPGLKNRARKLPDEVYNEVRPMIRDRWDLRGALMILGKVLKREAFAEAGLEPTPENEKTPRGARALRSFQARYKDLTTILEHFKFEEILGELKSMGIKFSDFHSGNIMKRGQDYVLIDLGRSGSEGSAPPVLEDVISEVVSEVVGSTGVSGPFTTNGTPGTSQLGPKGASGPWSTSDAIRWPKDETDRWEDDLSGRLIQKKGGI